MKRITDRLLTTAADRSSHSNIIVHLADRLLSRIAPQQTATAISCTSWRVVGCCSDGKGRFRRYCGGMAQYRCGNPTCW
ncbi:MAG: hypothetical protein AAGF95_17930 [Chloroflexota bacterium]